MLGPLPPATIFFLLEGVSPYPAQSPHGSKKSGFFLAFAGTDPALVSPAYFYLIIYPLSFLLYFQYFPLPLSFSFTLK